MGLAVNLISAWLLAGDHEHAGGHHHHGRSDHEHAGVPGRKLDTPWGSVELEICEDGVPPRFRPYGLPTGDVGVLQRAADQDLIADLQAVQERMNREG